MPKTYISFYFACATLPVSGGIGGKPFVEVKRVPYVGGGGYCEVIKCQKQLLMFTKSNSK